MTPDTDGIDHINIYSKGETELGRLLSNFAYTPFNHPEYGVFKSVEGFWYWWFTGKQHDHLRLLTGVYAKKEGKSLVTEGYEVGEEDKQGILEAIRCKLRQNKSLLKLLMHSTLPLMHYYAYGTTGKWRVFELPQFQWITDEIERIRKVCRQHYKLEKKDGNDKITVATN